MGCEISKTESLSQGWAENAALSIALEHSSFNRSLTTYGTSRRAWLARTLTENADTLIPVAHLR